MLFIVLYPSFSQTRDKERKGNPAPVGENELINEGKAQWDRYQYELSRSMDPATGCIPDNIRKKEMLFANRIADNNQFIAFQKNSNAPLQNVNWVSRGPAFIGGRTRALGIDVANENIILAGGTSGGMWRSTDRGDTWQRITPLSDLPSTTCLVQDKRTGKTNTWYYGTGELGGNTAAYPLWLNDGPYKWGAYYGNGIYKTTDNGITWNVLKSTAIDSIGGLNQPFNIVNSLALDRSNESQDIIYAAVAGGIERSSDGGNTWKIVLGSFPPGSLFTDVAVTSKGVVYALLGSNRVAYNLSNPYEGLYRSVDGINWTNISPKNWQHPIAYVSLAVAPSNENVVYIAFDSLTTVTTYSNVLWKYTYISGDGSGNGGIFEDRSANLNKSGVSFVAYVKVKPDEENTVFVGGLTLVRSIDGFATTSKISPMTVPHVDQNSMDFFPAHPEQMVIGSDGGIFLTGNNLAPSISWLNLNKNYITTQFYTVALDHSAPGDKTIIGGLKDNYTNFTNSSDATVPWKFLLGGDGAYCAIADGKSSFYVSYQWGATYRFILDEKGNRLAAGKIDPEGGEGYMFINPFCLDPNNSDLMYLAGGSSLWRNDSLFILLNGSDPTSVGWTKFTNSKVSPVGSIVLNCKITYIAASKKPANIVYYGTSDGQLFRMDAANTGNPLPKQIWQNKGFPANSFVSSIAIDRKNADNVLVAFANYNVQSLFYSSNGGSSWTPVSGNLEEHSDGTGNGPACRTVAILHSGDGIIYLAGTSTGLYSTSSLDGMNTIWTLEGANSIGNNIVNMIDTRESDGMVAVATCGHGMFSGQYEPANSVSDGKDNSDFIVLEQNFPNPFNSKTNIRFQVVKSGFVNLTVFDIFGKRVSTLINEYKAPGSYSVDFDGTNLANGIYYYKMNTGEFVESRKFVIVK